MTVKMKEGYTKVFQRQDVCCGKNILVGRDLLIFTDRTRHSFKTGGEKRGEETRIVRYRRDSNQAGSICTF